MRYAYVQAIHGSLNAAEVPTFAPVVFLSTSPLSSCLTFVLCASDLKHCVLCHLLP